MKQLWQQQLNAAIITVLLIVSAFCQANELSATTQQEITHLFSYLENSNCQFNRNGTWHNPKDAAAHLQEKYQYLLKKDLISSAETFIERAATKSSITGTPYEVKCGDAPPIQSATWFKAELDKYRQLKK